MVQYTTVSVEPRNIKLTIFLKMNEIKQKHSSQDLPVQSQQLIR